MPAGSVPKKVEDLVKDVKKKNPDYSTEKVWATAWAIYCKHVNNEDKSCKRGPEGYLKGKKGATIRDLHGYQWGPKLGLEGPFRYKTGVVLYWDPREASYYDPSRDVYIDYDEFADLTGEHPRKPIRAGLSDAARDRITSRLADSLVRTNLVR
jgi:hypothetical protein